MNCIEENIQFLDNPKQVIPVIHQILPNENYILKSHVFISFYDTKSFVFDETSSKTDSFLIYFLLESLKYKKYYESISQMYIDIRGGIINNNLLYDLKFSSNSKNGLVASLGKNFDKWIQRCVPNFFNMSITSSGDVYNCTNIFKKSIKDIQFLLSKTKNDCPRIYCIDFMKTNQNDKKNYYIGRWIFVDIPCFTNSFKNYEILSWFQSEDFLNVKKCNYKIDRNPLYAAIGGFLLKNTRTIICFTAKNPKLKTELDNIKEIFLHLKFSVEENYIISAKKYNRSWYSALNDIREICYLGRIITYVNAKTGKEGKKKRKVSDIKKIENTLKDIMEKFLNSNLTEDLGLINHKVFEAKVGPGTGKSICALICDVWNAITNLDQKLFEHLGGEKFISIISDDESSDDYSSSDDNLNDSAYEEEMYNSLIEFEKNIEQWNDCYEPIIESFIKEIKFEHEEYLPQIINNVCPNIHKEYDFIYYAKTILH
ncbi:Hypothetical protein SRAE_2000144600 [Strongyloides ratti]|uniref:Uncharacterized protein n=1 Tax=Strongyloides ratti TaxID=34506 RepID=A0A090LH35_STRRB|nr:Hypothetical protein SRAE_2000144600 [Strongyloides ratti]CEF66780.1 Hypothetical protein SRAE_2000144600 [Strongyloides ratti]